MVDKKQLTEEDIKHRYITPAIHQAGWNDELIFMEKYLIEHKTVVNVLGFIRNEEIAIPEIQRQFVRSCA